MVHQLDLLKWHKNFISASPGVHSCPLHCGQIQACSKAVQATSRANLKDLPSIMNDYAPGLPRYAVPDALAPHFDMSLLKLIA